MSTARDRFFEEVRNVAMPNTQEGKNQLALRVANTLRAITQELRGATDWRQDLDYKIAIGETAALLNRTLRHRPSE